MLNGSKKVLITGQEKQNVKSRLKKDPKVASEEQQTFGFLYEKECFYRLVSF